MLLHIGTNFGQIQSLLKLRANQASSIVKGNLNAKQQKSNLLLYCMAIPPSRYFSVADKPTSNIVTKLTDRQTNGRTDGQSHSHKHCIASGSGGTRPGWSVAAVALSGAHSAAHLGCRTWYGPVRWQPALDVPGGGVFRAHSTGWSAAPLWLWDDTPRRIPDIWRGPPCTWSRGETRRKHIQINLCNAI